MNKKTKHLIFLFFGLLLLNFANQKIYKRFDLTQDKRYTLSKITQDILTKIDQELLINVYLEGDFPSEFKRLQIETRQFLEELNAENGQVVFQFIHPASQAEKLIKKGMNPSQLTVEEGGKLSEEIIFPWAEISYRNKKAIVNLLPNSLVRSQEEQLQNAVENLEFSFLSALRSILKKEKKKIAIITGNGQLKDLYLYSFLSEISKKNSLAKFTLDSVASNPQKALQDLTKFDLAIIAKPTEKFTDQEKFALDQFITHGGKSLWMIDQAQADLDSLYNNGKMLAYPRDLNLTNLFFSYGIRINNLLIKDIYSAKISLATGNIGNKPQFQNLNWFFNPLVNGNPIHPITKNILPVRLQFATQIDTLKNNIKKTPLLVSSQFTQKVGLPNFIELQDIAEEPIKEKYNSGYQAFAFLLEGDFNSAYKNRIKPFSTSLYRENAIANKMIIISDGDIGKNQLLKGKPQDLSIDKWTSEEFGNKDFLLNAVDYLLDDEGLLTLRNKSLQINLLDKQKAFKERTFWQFINVGLPLTMLFVFGILFNYLRKKKYA
jgi:gliding-associated putative ABC transporter substrate-binding component GldG